MYEEQLRDFPTVGHLLFLCESYTTEYWWFEVLECSRRLLLTAVLGIISVASIAAPTMGVVISMLYMYCFIRFQPFVLQGNNALSVLLQYSTAFFYLGAIMAKMDLSDESSRDKQTFDALLMVVIISGPALILAKSFIDSSVVATKRVAPLVAPKWTAQQKAKATTKRAREKELERKREAFKGDPAAAKAMEQSARRRVTSHRCSATSNSKTAAAKPWNNLHGGG